MRREEVHHSSGCAPYQRILSACAPFVRPPILQPSAHRGHLSHNPSQNGSPATLTKASSSSSENIELSPVSGNDDDTGDKFALQADVNDKETLQNLRIHTWSMNIESAYLEVKLRIWT